MDNIKIQLDGWSDIYSGLGEENSDKTVNFESAMRMSAQELELIFSYNGLANIICTEIPGDAIKNGITIFNDSDNFIKKKLDKLNFSNTVFNAFSSARAFGGCVVVMDIDDGAEISEPVNVENINDIKSIEIYDRIKCIITTSNFNTDKDSDNFGKIEFYRIQLQNGTQLEVHYTRCLFFPGEYLTTTIKELNEFYDGSVIQRIYSSLTKIDPAFEYVNKLLKRSNILKFGVKGLSEIVLNGNADTVLDRLRILKRGMSIMNAAMYDPDGEEIVSESLQLTGLPDILKQFMIYLSAESRIPVNRLFSKLFGGISDGADSDEIRYLDYVKREQERVLKNEYNKIISYIANIKDSKLKSEDVYFIFNPLVSYSKKELIEMESKTIESLSKLFEWQVISKEQFQEALTKLDSIDISFDGLEGNL